MKKLSIIAVILVMVLSGCNKDIATVNGDGNSTSSDEIDNENNLQGDLKEIKRLLSLTEEEIYEEFGDPKSTGMLDGAMYMEYGDRFLHIQDENVVSVTLLDLNDMFSIEGKLNRENIVKQFGEPEIDGWQKEQIEGMDPGIVYEIDGLELRFINLGEKSENLLIKRHE